MKLRTKIISATLLPGEHEALRRLAFEENATISSLIRELLLESPRVQQALSFLPPVESINSKTEPANTEQKNVHAPIEVKNAISAPQS
jgi:hypothetical protein